MFEPWVEHTREFSMHFDVQKSTAHSVPRVQFVGHCQLVTDSGGVYRGSRVIPDVPLPEGALECGQKVCHELAQLGYWGPIGIDAFEGVLNGTPVLRPLVEINARYSFGRMASGSRGLAA